MSQYYLYIDHQKLAPLIRQLEDTIEKTEDELDNSQMTYQLRAAIYQEFITTIYTLYNQNFKDIKLEDPQTPLIYAPLKPIEQEEAHHNQERIDNQGLQQEHKQVFRVKTRSKHNLQAEIQLIQWIISCNRTSFQKKQIVEKYSQLSKSKKKLTLDNIMNLLQKYKMKHIIVVSKQGKQHVLKEEVEQTLTFLVKQEEISRQISRMETMDNFQESMEAGQKQEKQHTQDDQNLQSVFLDDVTQAGEQKDVKSVQGNLVSKNDQ